MNNPTAPLAPRRSTEITAQGDPRIDDWAWLRDRSDPAVVAHLEAENAYTAAASAHLAHLRQSLFEEIRSRIAETDLSVPVRKGPWWYFDRTTEGSAYAIHCRLPGDDPTPGRLPGDDPTQPPVVDPGIPRAGEQVLLDENLLAAGHAYLDVANLAISPDHGLLAYAVDTTGDERFELRVRDLASGSDLPETLQGTSYGIAWAADSLTLFYTRPDAANRPYQLWRHRAGTPEHDDAMIYEEIDERFHLGVASTKDDRYILLILQSKITSEVHVLPADEPMGDFRVLARRAQGIEYAVEHYQGRFLALTNYDAENFRLVQRPVDAAMRDCTGLDHWDELIAHRPGIRLEGIDVFDHHLVCYERLDGSPRIRVHPISPLGPAPNSERGTADEASRQGEVWGLGEDWLVECPEVPSASWGGANPEPSSPTLRYEYSSLVTPRSVLDLDLSTRTAILRKRQPVLGGYEPNLYATERQWATAPDGTSVPLSIVYRHDTPLDGTAPCLLYGYGAYEYSIDPVFSSIRLSLLNRGFVFAIAHVRGGGELGRHWYENGKLLAKPNTFADFIACAHHLVDGGWTSPGKLVARGGSAGGLLMGAVANLAPDLFRAIVAEVPFVDCLTTMLDESLPLTAIEWEEWGNPASDPAVYRVMKSYTPYDNVRPVHYPDVLATAGLEDPRVGYWEPAKWVQKIRAADPSNRVLLKIDMEAGHGGPTGRYEAWREEAFVLAFVLDAVGLAQAGPDTAGGTAS
ncbi:MAG: S9 family peptidase [Acidimicrobiales bacterium]